MDQDQDSPPKPPQAVTQATTRSPEGETAFDLWLNRSLHALYDSVATEPIPPELLRLIEDDKARRKG